MIDNGYRERITNTLTKNENMISNKQKQISELGYEIELLQNNSVKTIQNILDVNAGTDFHTIWLDFDQEKHKFKKECKDSKNWITYLEDNYFFGKNHQYKLIGIVMFGYMEAYELRYKLNNIEFIINIPIYKQARLENYDRMYYEIMDIPNDFTYEVVFRTRFIEDMKGAIEDFIEKKINTDKPKQN